VEDGTPSLCLAVNRAANCGEEAGGEVAGGTAGGCLSTAWAGGGPGDVLLLAGSAGPSPCKVTAYAMGRVGEYI